MFRKFPCQYQVDSLVNENTCVVDPVLSLATVATYGFKSITEFEERHSLFFRWFHVLKVSLS